MRAYPVLIFVVVAGLTAGACTTANPKWVRAHDGAESLKSALYWCRRVQREKFYKQSITAKPERERHVTTDEKCMKQRGWRREK